MFLPSRGLQISFRFPFFQFAPSPPRCPQLCPHFLFPRTHSPPFKQNLSGKWSSVKKDPLHFWGLCRIFLVSFPFPSQPSLPPLFSRPLRRFLQRAPRESGLLPFKGVPHPDKMVLLPPLPYAAFVPPPAINSRVEFSSLCWGTPLLSLKTSPLLPHCFSFWFSP